jgi:hypothetical protein
MANHASTRTTQLYDRRRDEVSLDEGRADRDLMAAVTCVPILHLPSPASERGGFGADFGHCLFTWTYLAVGADSKQIAGS